MTALPKSTALRAGPVWIGTKDITPLGSLWVGVSEKGLAAVDLRSDEGAFALQLKKLGFTEINLSVERVQIFLDQILEYLQGRRQEFVFPIDWTGLTAFQEDVLRATFAIPYGETRTYAALASQVGRPRAARAVGQAEATNPMPVVIPCHRMIGSDGRLHGYGAGEGLATKSWLLDLERGQAGVPK